MIIENEPNINRAIYDSLKEDYMAKLLTNKEIQKKYGLSHNRLKHYRDKIYEETGFTRRKRKDNRVKIIHRYHMYQIFAPHRGEIRKYGWYNEYDTALKVKEQLDIKGYDLDNLPGIFEDLNLKKGGLLDFHKETQEEFLQYYENGVDRREICKKYGFNEHKFYRYLRKLIKQ